MMHHSGRYVPREWGVISPMRQKTPLSWPDLIGPSSIPETPRLIADVSGILGRPVPPTPRLRRGRRLAGHAEALTKAASRATTPKLLFEIRIRTTNVRDRPSHLPLRVLRIALRLLRLLVLLGGAVVAGGAAGGSAEHAVMAGKMAGNAADDRALDATLGVGGRGRSQRESSDGESGECGLHDACLR